MQKVLVIGSNGAGKSVFARAFGAKSGLPVVHLDKLFHAKGWQGMAHEEWDAVLGKLLAEKSWIMDGLYIRTLRRRLTHADTVFFLDFPVWLTLHRALARRWIYRHGGRPDLPVGLKEQFNLGFIKTILTFPRSAVLAELRRLPATTKVIIFSNPRDVQKYLGK